MHVVISLLRLTYHLIMSLRTKVLDIWHLKVQNQDSDCGGCRCQVDAPSRWFCCRTGRDARWGSGYGCSGGHWCCSCWRIVTEVILAAVAITSMYQRVCLKIAIGGTVQWNKQGKAGIIGLVSNATNTFDHAGYIAARGYPRRTTGSAEVWLTWVASYGPSYQKKEIV